MKREAGENPARGRRCKGRVLLRGRKSAIVQSLLLRKVGREGSSRVWSDLSQKTCLIVSLPLICRAYTGRRGYNQKI